MNYITLNTLLYSTLHYTLLQEFWFTAGATFFYFTAFVSILTGFVGYEDEEYQYWIDANIAAGVSHNECFVRRKHEDFSLRFYKHSNKAIIL